MRRATLRYAVAGGVLLAGYLWLPKASQNILYSLICASVIGAILVGVAGNRVRSRLPWYLFAGAQACYLVADTWWSVVEQRLGEVPVPSVIDAAYLAYYPLLAAGMLILARRSAQYGRLATTVDAVVIATATGLVTWVLIRPSVLDSELSAAARAVTLAYPLGDLILLVTALQLALGPGRRSPAFRLVVLSILLTTLADLLYLVVTARGEYTSGSPLDLLWLAGYLAFGAAALHPTMRELGEPGTHRIRRLGPARTTLLVASMLALPVSLAAGAGSNHPTDALVFAVGGTGVCGLLLVRVLHLVRQLERGKVRERILREGSVDLVSATTTDQVTACVTETAIRLVGPGARVQIRRVGPESDPGPEPDPGPESDPGPAADLAPPGGSQDQQPGDDPHLVSIPFAGDGAGGGWLISVWSPRGPEPLLSSLRTLASGAALALDALARDELRLRDERRFRAIAKASSDIMFLANTDGTITWCADSVERICGYRAADLIGQRLAGLLHPADAQTYGCLAETMARSNLPVRVDARLRLADGSHRVFQVTGQNLLDEPDVGGLVITGLDVTERRELADQLAARAFYDDLTQLPNRALFLDRVGQGLARFVRDGRPRAVILIGLDGFKAVNDSLGHDAGDQLLVQVTQRLSGELRTVETVARLGGDEFGVLVDDALPEDVIAIAQRLLAAVNEPFVVARREVYVSASIGVATVQDDASDPESLLRDANIAMRRAKAAGKNRAKVFRPSMYLEAVQRLEFSGDLQRALDRGELVVHYQPIVELGAGRTSGFEALVRWRHPVHGLVRPTEFIPLAEESGLIVPVGRWVLGQACQQVARWQGQFDRPLSIAVNLSAKQLVDDGALADVRAALLASGLEPGRLTLELTESALMADLDEAAGRLAALRELGVRIAIDDFGTGYSSLSYLDRLPVDTIKIDRSFVLALDDPDREPTLVRVIVDLAQRLGLPTVAEGIENPAQLRRLMDLGCQYGQGFLFSPPQEPKLLEQILPDRMAQVSWPVAGVRSR